jgi:predicted AlkP superfamily phosphohydrolase/phosphomutase
MTPFKLPKQIVVLGFDAMDIELVRSWSQSGYLPTFQRLFDTCAWSDFYHPPEYTSGVIWSSINTGLPPQEHDFYYFGRFLKDSYRMRIGRPSDLQGEFYWQWFAESGRRIVIADVPFSIPNVALGGLQYWGWGQHDWTTNKTSVPRSLLRRLTAQFGKHPVPSCGHYSIMTESLCQLKARLIEGIRRRTALLRSLISQERWELLSAVFCEAHCAGHLMWHLDDEAHPQHNPTQLALVGHGLRDVYSALDHALGELMAACPPDTACIVFFSHGMGPNHHADHLFSEFLQRFNQRQQTGGEPPPSAHGHPVGGAFATLWQHSVGRIPATWRRRIEHGLPIDFRSWLMLKRDQDPKGWARMPSFALPLSDGFSAVRINLVGREAAGRVTAGDAYHAYLQALIRELFSLEHADTSEPAVEAVYRPDEQTDPATFGAAPDLVIWWHKLRPFRAICSPALGTISGEPIDTRPGEHIMRGMLLVSHAQARAGYQPTRDLTALDIAPTICGMADIPPRQALSGINRCHDFLRI